MLDLINPDVLARSSAIGEAFRSAQPFRHVVIDDFVLPDLCRELIAGFPRFRENKARNEFGEVGRKAVFRDVAKLGPAYARVDRMLQSKDFLSWVSDATGIPDLLYDPEYVGGGTHENLSGQDLDPHVDFNYHPARGLHRRLNLILFLNPEWREEWGGALELHRDPWQPEADEVKSILPVANRCVLFETNEISWHGFRRIAIPADRPEIFAALARGLLLYEDEAG